jgi:hypothetical protein
MTTHLHRIVLGLLQLKTDAIEMIVMLIEYPALSLTPYEQPVSNEKLELTEI